MAKPARAIGGSSTDARAGELTKPRPLPPDKPAPAETPPPVVEYYWMEGAMKPEAARVACCDYSVPRTGRLVAYRWDGEGMLEAGRFVGSDG